MNPYRRGVQKAKQQRRGLIADHTFQLLSRMDAAVSTANAKMIWNRTLSHAVIGSANDVASGIHDFHGVLSIDAAPRAWNPRRLGRGADIGAHAIQGAKDNGPRAIATVATLAGLVFARTSCRTDRRVRPAGRRGQAQGSQIRAAASRLATRSRAASSGVAQAHRSRPADCCIRLRPSHKPAGSSTFCASTTKRRFRREPFRSRRVRFGRRGARVRSAKNAVVTFVQRPWFVRQPRLPGRSSRASVTASGVKEQCRYGDQCSCAKGPRALGSRASQW